MADCSSTAVDWLFTVASTYNVDTTRIILYGQSRGGFITGDLLWNVNRDRSRFAGGIIANGINKFHLDYLEEIEGPTVPVLLVSSEDDNVVKHGPSDSAYEDLKNKGTDVEYVLYEKASHNPRKGSGSLYEHVTDFLHKFETELPPKVDIDVWPQVCAKKCTCFDSGAVEFEVADRMACQERADKAGHRYIQYLESKKLCASSLSCDNADRRAKDDWEIFWRPRSHGSVVLPPPTPPMPPVLTSEPTTAPTKAPTDADVAPEPSSEESPAPSPEPRFCKSDCSWRPQEWTTKCTWNKCKECSECLSAPPTPTTSAPPSDDRFCREDCETRPQEWLKKCTWNSCKNCPACQ